MSKKTEKISALERRLSATNAVLYGIAEALGVDFDGDVDVTNVATHLAPFVGAIRRPAPAAQPFDALVEREVQRIDQAIATTGPSGDVTDAFALRSILEATADELGLMERVRVLGNVAAADVIREEITRLKNPPAATSEAVVVTTTDSLAQAIEHNRAQRQDLEDALIASRAVINRIAGAMQIDRWDADGTELVSRAQRWNSFKVTLTSIANQWRGRPADETVPAATVAQQFQALLTTLVSTREFARWLENKPKTLVVSQALHEAVTNPPEPVFGPFGPGDIMRLQHAISVSLDVLHQPPTALEEYLDKVFTALAASTVASKEFCDLMNLIILPILARQAPVGTHASRKN